MTPEFREFLRTFDAKSPLRDSVSLEVVWNSAEITLDMLPTRFTWVTPVMDDPSPPVQDRQAPNLLDKFAWATHVSTKSPSWATDTRSRNAWYWGRIAATIKSLAFLHSAKITTLMAGIERAVVESNSLVLALLLRSLFENCASLYALKTLMKEHLHGFHVDCLETELVTNEVLHRELSKLFRGTRFNWEALVKGDADAWIKKAEFRKRTEAAAPEHFQESIMEHIDRVASNPRYSAFRHLYSFLCDYVHPNVGSNLLFLKNAHEIRGRVVLGFGLGASPVEISDFLTPFIGGIWSCFDIATNALPQLRPIGEYLENWCESIWPKYAFQDD